MIIDKILDRKDGEPYSARQFYIDCMCYGEIGEDITRAMDYGSNIEVKKALCKYIDDNDYNPAIKDYINSVSWVY